MSLLFSAFALAGDSPSIPNARPILKLCEERKEKTALDMKKYDEVWEEFGIAAKVYFEKADKKRVELFMKNRPDWVHLALAGFPNFIRPLWPKAYYYQDCATFHYQFRKSREAKDHVLWSDCLKSFYRSTDMPKPVKGCLEATRVNGQ